MTYQKPKNIVEDVAALYANIVESQTEKVEQLNEAPSVTTQPGTRTGSNPNVFRPIPSAPGSRRGAAPVPSRSTAPAAKPAPSTPVTKPAPSAQGSQYNMKNLGAAQYAAFKGGGGDAAIKQGYSAGEVVARGRAAINRASGNQPAPATKPVPTGGATRPPVGGTPTSAKPAPTTTSTTTPTAGTTPTTPVTPQRSFNPLMQRTFGYQTGNAPDQIAAASKAVPQATSDAAFKKSAQMVKNIKPSANLNMELDLFDVIKGHLLDEGYAETEDAAIAIMANMGEQWKQSIVEEATDDPIDVDHRTQRLPNGRIPKPTPQQVSATADALKLRARARLKGV